MTDTKPEVKAESERLAFIAKRDGEEAAIEFAQRTLRIYRTSVLKNGRHGRQFHFASHGEYRRRFIESYCEFKRYLTEAGGKTPLDGI